jgi:acyl carrier protein
VAGNAQAMSSTAAKPDRSDMMDLPLVATFCGRSVGSPGIRPAGCGIMSRAQRRLVAPGFPAKFLNNRSFPARLPALNLRLVFAIRAPTFSRGRWPQRGVPTAIEHTAARRRNACSIRDLLMSSTFDTVANIISETCDIPREKIKPESHAINDLGIDSLDFLDIAFAIDKAFGIKMPLEQWTQEVNDGKATTDQYFQLNNLCTRIDELVAAKGA